MARNNGQRPGLRTPEKRTYVETTLAEKLDPGEIRQRARSWFHRQIEIISKAHGASWPEHKEWIEAYLGEEIRQRLFDLGWRVKE